MRDGALRVGFVGCGYIADWHRKAVRAVGGAELVAVCDAALDRAQAFVGDSGVKAFADVSAMLDAMELDVVHVLVPPEHHAAVARTVLEHKVACLMEKPMAPTSAACDALVAVAAASGAPLGVAHNFLFHPAYLPLRADVHTGRLGRLRHLRVEWAKELGQIAGGPHGGWLFAAPENVLFEVGAHVTAQVLDLVPAREVVSARATGHIALPGGRETYRRTWAMLQAGDVDVDVSISLLPGIAEHTVHARGEFAVAACDFETRTSTRRAHTAMADDFDRFAQITRESVARGGQALAGLSAWVMQTAKLKKSGNGYGDSIAGAVAAFYDAVRSGGPPDVRVSGAFGRDVIALCEQIADASGARKRLVPAAATPRAAARATPRVLVLGATGFIGRAFVEHLAAQNTPFRVLARSDAKLQGLPASLLDVVKGDLRRPDDVRRALDGIERVVHLARAHVKSWPDYLRDEVEVTERIGEACIAAGVQRLVYAGTIDSLYAGHDGVIPDGGAVDPHIERRNLYARAKAESEKRLQALAQGGRLKLVIVRPGIVIGRGGSPYHWGVGAWPHPGVCEVWGDGRNPLPLVLVDDVANGLLAALFKDGIDGRVYHLVGPPLLSAHDYLDALERAGSMKLTRVTAQPASAFAIDALKQATKFMVRHPERRLPSLRDWQSRTQRARFDIAVTCKELDWQPTHDIAALVKDGIELPLKELLS